MLLKTGLLTMRLLFPTTKTQFGPVSNAHAVSKCCSEFYFIFYSHRYATRKHQLPVQVHPQVQWCYHLGVGPE